MPLVGELEPTRDTPYETLRCAFNVSRISIRGTVACLNDIPVAAEKWIY